MDVPLPPDLDFAPTDPTETEEFAAPLPDDWPGPSADDEDEDADGQLQLPFHPWEW